MALSDKVVIRVDDLMTWIIDDIDWNWGLQAAYIDLKSATNSSKLGSQAVLKSTQLDFNDVAVEKEISKFAFFNFFHLHDNIFDLCFHILV